MWTREEHSSGGAAWEGGALILEPCLVVERWKSYLQGRFCYLCRHKINLAVEGGHFTPR